jgi:hypothetical protein
MSASAHRQQTDELAVFAHFLEAYPTFAAEVDSYKPGAEEPADITVRLKSGRRIDFQLGEWLHKQQIEEAKRKKTLRDKLRAVLACPDFRDFRPRNFKHVYIYVKKDSDFAQKDAESFRKEFRCIVSQVDRSCNPSWYPGGYPLSSFQGYPTINKYCERILFLPRNSHIETVISDALDRAQKDPEICRLLEQMDQERVRGEATGSPAVDSDRSDPSWIDFPLEGGAYSSESALKALKEILANKTKRYAQQATDLRLIIHYNDAALYNDPYQDQKHQTFADMACRASRMLAKKKVAAFTSIYLLRALRPNPEAFEVWPTLCKCV